MGARQKWAIVSALILHWTLALAQPERPAILLLVDMDTPAGREIDCAFRLGAGGNFDINRQDYRDPAGAVQSVRSTLSQFGRTTVAVVGPQGYAADMAVNDVLRDSRVAQISLALIPTPVERRHAEYLRVGPTIGKLRQAGETYLLNQWKVANLAVIGVPPGEAFAGTGGAQEYFGRLGVKAQGEAFSSQSAFEAKFNSQESNLGVVFVPSDLSGATTAAQRYSKAKIVSVQPRAVDPGALPNLYVAAPADPRRIASARQFVRDFSSKCQGLSLLGIALPAYVAAQTLRQALSAGGGSVNAASTLAALRKGPFETAVGSSKRYGSDGELHYGTWAIWGHGEDGNPVVVAQSTESTKEKCQGNVCSECSDCKVDGKCDSTKTCPAK